MEQLSNQSGNPVARAMKGILAERDYTSPSNCEHCGKEYKPFNMVYPEPHVIYIPDCGCLDLIRKQEDDRRYREAINQKMLESIPVKFRASSFETYKPKNKAQESALSEMMASPKASFYLQGSYGSGKTHLLCSQYKACFTKEKCFLRTTSELIREIRNEELGNGSSEIMHNLRGRRPFHLFWDDCDKVKTTDFKLEIIFDLIDGIYKHEMGLSVTSNDDLGELQAKLSPAVVRRIDDICKVITL